MFDPVAVVFASSLSFHKMVTATKKIFLGRISSRQINFGKKTN
jgi:hypothetical protein